DQRQDVWVVTLKQDAGRRCIGRVGHLGPDRRGRGRKRPPRAGASGNRGPPGARGAGVLRHGAPPTPAGPPDPSPPRLPLTHHDPLWPVRKLLVRPPDADGAGVPTWRPGRCATPRPPGRVTKRPGQAVGASPIPCHSRTPIITDTL